MVSLICEVEGYPQALLNRGTFAFVTLLQLNCTFSESQLDTEKVEL